MVVRGTGDSSPATPSRASSDPKAIAPRPTPHRCKNCRRANSRAGSSNDDGPTPRDVLPCPVFRRVRFVIRTSEFVILSSLGISEFVILRSSVRVSRPVPSLPRNKLVQIHQHAGDRDPGRGFRRRCAFGQGRAGNPSRLVRRRRPTRCVVASGTPPAAPIPAAPLAGPRPRESPIGAAEIVTDGRLLTTAGRTLVPIRTTLDRWPS